MHLKSQNHIKKHVHAIETKM